MCFFLVVFAIILSHAPIEHWGTQIGAGISFALSLGLYGSSPPREQEVITEANFHGTGSSYSLRAFEVQRCSL